MAKIITKTVMLKGEKGKDGTSILTLEKTGTSGATDTYTITLTDGSKYSFNVTNGSNIASIEKTSTSGLVDTYTITLNNGDTSTFDVTNGHDYKIATFTTKKTGYSRATNITSLTSAIAFNSIWRVINETLPEGYQAVLITHVTALYYASQSDYEDDIPKSFPNAITTIDCPNNGSQIFRMKSEKTVTSYGEKWMFTALLERT